MSEFPQPRKDRTWIVIAIRRPSFDSGRLIIDGSGLLPGRPTKVDASLVPPVYPE
jgi:hypothetical protein